MSDGIKIHTLRVFRDHHGQFGNPLGIILDEGKKINPIDRQRIATQLGFSESVFIDNLNAGNVSIFNPQNEVPFAGHALVGTAWLIAKLRNQSVDSLVCLGGNVKTWVENDKIWIRVGLKALPSWNLEQMSTVTEVENLPTTVKSSKTHAFVWAWINERKGLVRARTFAPDWGIPEDEANGSGSMRLAAMLGRSIEVIHGKGSIIYAKPWKSDFVDLGGGVIGV